MATDPSRVHSPQDLALGQQQPRNQPLGLMHHPLVSQPTKAQKTSKDTTIRSTDEATKEPQPLRQRIHSNTVQRNIHHLLHKRRQRETRTPLGAKTASTDIGHGVASRPLCKTIIASICFEAPRKTCVFFV